MVVYRKGNKCRRVPVDLIFRLQVVFSKVFVDITISCSSFVFSQSRAKVSAGFTNLRGPAVSAFDLLYCSLSVLRFVFVLDISK